MNTIDHLISYPTEADALASPDMAPWVVDGNFNRSVVFPDLTLWTSGGFPFPGYWLLISTDGRAPDPRLTAIEPCRMVADRDRAAQGLAYIFQEGLRASPEQMAEITRIDGLPAGSAYPLRDIRIIS